MASSRMFIIFAIIIASGVAGVIWPYFAYMHLDSVPINASKWHMGKGSQYNPVMTYEINYNGTNTISQTVPVGQVYYFTDVSNQSRTYFDMLDNSLFSMNWYATNDKYLAVGASWGSVYIWDVHEHMKVRSLS